MLFVISHYTGIICILCFFLQRFTECAHQTFIFDGRCYNTCPERSFIVEEKVSENVGEAKGLSVKKKRHAMNIDEFDNLQDIIGRTEYVLKNRAITTSPSQSASPQKLCGSCHESCLKCNGPTENDCLTCEADYNQIIIGSSITCHPKSSSSPPSSTAVLFNDGNKSTLNSITSKLKNYSIEKIVLVSSMFGILLMTTCICIYILFIKCDCDILSSFYDKTKQLIRKASGSKVVNTTEREKYTYNIVEMEERSPLTDLLPTDFQIVNNDDDYEDSDDEEEIE